MLLLKYWVWILDLWITDICFRFRPKSEGGEGGYGGSESQAQPEGPTTQQQQHQQFLGDASGAIPNFGDIDLSSQPLPDGITPDHVHIFQKMYREHAEVNIHWVCLYAIRLECTKLLSSNWLSAKCFSEFHLIKWHFIVIGW